MTDDKTSQYPIKRQESGPVRPFENHPDIDLEAYKALQHLVSQSRPNAESSAGAFSLRDILYVFFRHKKKIAAVFLLASLGTVLFLASDVSMYKSEAKVFIRGDRNSVAVDPTAESNSFLKSGQGADVQVRSEMALITSAAVAEKAVDAVGLDNILKSTAKTKQQGVIKESLLERTIRVTRAGIKMPVKQAFAFLHLNQPSLSPRDRVIQGITSALEVAPSSGGSAVLDVTYAAADPAIAQKILNGVLDGYLHTHISMHKSPISPNFFKGRAGQIQQKLHEKEAAYDKRRKELNIASMPTEKELLLNQLNLLETRISETGAEMSSSQAKISAFRKTLSGTKSSSSLPDAISDVSLNPEAARLSEQLVQLRMKEMDLRTKYKDGYKDLEDVRNQIKQVTSMITTTRSPANPALRAADPLRQGLALQHETERALLDGLAARETRLNTEASTIRNRLRELTSHEKELDSLQREVALVDSEYQLYMKTLQASQIDDLLDRSNVGNVSILQNATRPSHTVRTQKKTLALLAFGIFMGFAGGVGLAFILEFLNHSIRTTEDVEKNLGLPVLISIPISRRHKPSLEEEIA